MSYSYEKLPHPNIDDLRAHLVCAQNHLDMKQLQFQCWPKWTVIIKVPNMIDFAFCMTDEAPIGTISFTMDARALYGMLTKKIHFNNLETGCHIEIHREPNEYSADLHTMMSFFHV